VNDALSTAVLALMIHQRSTRVVHLDTRTLHGDAEKSRSPMPGAGVMSS
jgi:hypothetical protein